jgi:hypothetical protein
VAVLCVRRRRRRHRRRHRHRHRRCRWYQRRRRRRRARLAGDSVGLRQRLGGCHKLEHKIGNGNENADATGIVQSRDAVIDRLGRENALAQPPGVQIRVAVGVVLRVGLA